MITLETFRVLVADEMDELPQVFFLELNGGVMVEQYAKPHPMRRADDLYILGEYQRSGYLGRSIVLYYGSFMRMMPHASESQMRREIRRVLRHEFRHHLEGLSGVRDLEVEDEEFLRNYLARFSH
jgi:predicted Zn-dependent protease with MMP-like domain